MRAALTGTDGHAVVHQFLFYIKKKTKAESSVCLLFTFPCNAHDIPQQEPKMKR